MKLILAAILINLLPSMVYAQSSSIPLYSGNIPGSKPAPADYIETTDERDFVKMVTVPTITAYPADKSIATSTAVIIFPGGGYSGLAMNHEGIAVAQAFNRIGITAFVVKYRLPDDRIMLDKKTGPLQDAQQAIWYVRKNAATWGIDPAKTGIIGFSAGGHLASTLGTHSDKNYIGTTDGTSLMPSFMMLIYPVISMGPITHSGSKENLLGKNPSAEDVQYFSNELQVKPETAPTFLVHSNDDDVVNVKNAQHFYEALQALKIPSELRLYEKGGHGYGLNNPTTQDPWFNHCAQWLKARGF